MLCVDALSLWVNVWSLCLDVWLQTHANTRKYAHTLAHCFTLNQAERSEGMEMASIPLA